MTKKRKKTELGRTLAKIRIDFDQTGAEMANILGISSSQMFNIEVGLAQVGYEFIGKVKELYEIDLADLMKRGGFMSKITLDLDELSQEDKAAVLEIWSKKWDRELPITAAIKEMPAKVASVAPTPDPEQTEKPRVVNDTVGDRKTRGRPKTIRARDGIGFLDEEGEDELDGIEEADCL